MKHTKKPVAFTLAEWNKLINPNGVVLAEMLSYASGAQSLVECIPMALKPNGGVLARSGYATRDALMDMLFNHAVQLSTSSVNQSRFRFFYEALRDNIVSPTDTPEEADKLQTKVFRILTDMMIKINALKSDLRLLKAHVATLYHLLDPRGLESTSTVAARLFQPKSLAAECLWRLEAAFPTLLATDAGTILRLAAPTPSGAVSSSCTTLAATVCSNLCELYLKQQSNETPDSNLSKVVEEDGISDDDSYTRARPRGGEDYWCIDTLSSSSPSGVVSASIFAAPSEPSTQNSRRSLLAAGDRDSRRSLLSGDSRNSLLSTATDEHQAGTSTSGSRVSLLSSALSQPQQIQTQHRLARSSSSTLDISTPRTIDSCSSLFTSRDMPIIKPPSGTPLRRLQLLPHLVYDADGESQGTAPRLLLTPDSQAELQAAVKQFINALRRMPATASSEVAKRLISILRVAPGPQHELWQMFERVLMTRSTPLLKAVLGFYDELPELFEGRGPALVEKVLQQVTDSMLSPDHRVVAASWLLRSHAAAVHHGGTLLLADGWDRLLLCDDDPAALATVKIKCLAACVSAGIADAMTVCRSVTTWQGFSNSKSDPTDQQLRSLAYALRVLRSIKCPDEASTHKSQACLAASIIHLLATRPLLTPAVDTFIRQCDGLFTMTMLRALDAMFSAVDGQFEVLLERPEEKTPSSESVVLSSSKVTSALLNRSSSLSGLFRGLSFQLSFNGRRNKSFIPGAARPPSVSGGSDTSAAATPRAVVQKRTAAVKHLRSSVANVFDVTGKSSGSGLMTVNELNGLDSEYGFDNAMMDETTEAMSVYECEIPCPPSDMTTWADAEAWLSSKNTWEGPIAESMLRHDVLHYRKLMQLVLQVPTGLPRGTLQVLANYCWQYKEHHPSHALSTQHTGAAILALCHTAALVHLLMTTSSSSDGEKWDPRQQEVSRAVHAVLDALEEGFPDTQVAVCSKELGEMLSIAEDGCGMDSIRRCEMLEKLLRSYIDAAVEA